MKKVSSNMMAEMDPKMNSQSGTGGRNTTFSSMTTTTRTTTSSQSSSRAGIGLDRPLVISIPGILSLVAIVLAFIAMICISASLPTHYILSEVTDRNASVFEFHQFTTIASWISLSVFTVIAFLQVYRVLSIRAIVIKFIMIGHSAVWALFLLISSAVLLGFVNKNQAMFSNFVSPGGCRASAAFGLLESFTLMGVVVILVLDILGIWRQNSIFQ